MCGIFFVLNKKYKTDIDKCKKSLFELKKRGPDNNFFIAKENIFLGQTTLSITTKSNDNIEAIHKSHDGYKNLLFNGEIYNFKMLKKELVSKYNCKIISNSDTEVLVNLFSFQNPEKVLSYLNGMFAFVLYDEVNNKIYFARDHIGEKILYIYNEDDCLIISSEIKPIVTYKKNIELNTIKLKEYFHTRHLVTNVNTCFTNINTVAPGILYVFDINSNKISSLKNYSLHTHVDSQSYFNFKENNQQEILNLSIEKFFKASEIIKPEINYASVCSGGIDSSLASILMSKTNRKPYKNIALNFDYKDESFNNISLIEKETDIYVDRLNISIDDYANKINEIYEYNCSPLATHSFISQYFVSNFCKQNNIKVLLTGDGGDELFGGYELYKKYKYLNQIPKISPSNYSNLQFENIFFNDEIIEVQKKNLELQWKKSLETYDFIDNEKERIEQAMLLTDSYLQLESVGIRSSDMMSMINSVEARSIYLLKDIVKLALNLPIEYKINNKEEENFKTKFLLKKILKILCNEKEDVIVRKQGFSGFPNEAGKLILQNNQFKRSTEVLGLPKNSFEIIKNNRALEWKLINIELFLLNYL